MALGHVRAFNNDAVCVREVLERSCRTASSKRGPQTGDRGRVSNTSLILYLDDA
jgi:hypothetical protein